jgi:DNA-binding transcriptional MocR family regulator
MNYPKIYRHVDYCMPTFKNLTGTTMSPRRCELVMLATRFDALIIVDEVFGFFRWGKRSKEKPMSRVVDIDRMFSGTEVYGNVVSNASFSASIAGGVV